MSTEDLVLLHNPRCSKSRTLKALLDERGVAYQERLYLDAPLSREELEALRAKIGDAGCMVRRKEAEFAEAGLAADSDDGAILDAIARFPKLLERPVLIRGDRARIGRPSPNAALELLDD